MPSIHDSNENRSCGGVDGGLVRRAFVLLTSTLGAAVTIGTTARTARAKGNEQNIADGLEARVNSDRTGLINESDDDV